MIFDGALLLSEFDVTASTDCNSDYVTVTTGDPAQVLEAFIEESQKYKNPKGSKRSPKTGRPPKTLFWSDLFVNFLLLREAPPPATAASLPLLTLSPWASCSRSSSTPTRCTFSSTALIFDSVPTWYYSPSPQPSALQGFALEILMICFSKIVSAGGGHCISACTSV